MLLGLVYGYVPFMVLPIYATLERLDPSLAEAAADLGARPLATLFRVIVPLAKPGIIAGSVLVFVPFKYVYPSYLTVLKRTTAVLTALAAAVVIYACLDPERARALQLPWLALGYVFYYFALSLWLGGLHRR